MKRWLIVSMIVVALMTVSLIMLFRVANTPPTRPPPPGILWEARYNGPSNEGDTPRFIATDPSGNIVVAGNAVVKYEGTHGRLLWAQPLGANALTIDSRGEVYIAGSEASGYTNSPTDPYAEANYAITVQRLSSHTGEMLWKKTYEGRHHDADTPSGIALDPFGNLVVAVFAPNDTRHYYYLAKYNTTDGTRFWEHLSEDKNGVTLNHRYLDVRIDASGDIFMAGTREETQLDHSTRFRFYIAKVRGTDGELLWEQHIGEGPRTFDSVCSFSLDHNGNPFVTGYSCDGFKFTTITVKLAGQDGRSLWTERHAMGRDIASYPTTLQIDKRGDVFVMAGFTWNKNISFPEYEGHLLKYSGDDGHLLWKQSHIVRLPSTLLSEDLSGNAILDANENVVVSSNIWNEKNLDYHLLWFANTNGSLFRTETLNGAADDHDLAFTAVAAPDGGIVVTGSSSNCRSGLKWAKEVSYRWRTGRNWRDDYYESNHVNNYDPYNYDFLTVKFPDSGFPKQPKSGK